MMSLPSSLFSDDSSEEDEDSNFFFVGNVDAVAFRDVDKQVAFQTTVSGRPFLKRPTIKKLQKLREIQANVNGFAVLTEKKDSCSGTREVKVDLIFSTLNRKELDFSWLFQGQISLDSGDVDALGGDGMILVEGKEALSFGHEEGSRRKRRILYRGYIKEWESDNEIVWSID